MHPRNKRDDSMASADKEMEERAKRAKELLSQRYRGLRSEQVRFSMDVLFLLRSLYSAGSHLEDLDFFPKLNRHTGSEIRAKNATGEENDGTARRKEERNSTTTGT